jgi:hypothetical protein
MIVAPSPLIPEGPNPQQVFDRWVRDAIESLAKIQQVSGARVMRTTRGTAVISDVTDKVPVAGTIVSRLVLRDVLTEYLICAKMPTGPDGSSPNWKGALAADLGSPSENDAYYNTSSNTFRIFFSAAWSEMTVGAIVNVAKQPALRTSLLGEKILGVNHTYTYGDGPSETWAVATDTRFNKTRTDDDGTDTEDQRVIRPYVDGEMIFAIRADTGIVTEGEGPVAVKFLELTPRLWAGPKEPV